MARQPKPTPSTSRFHVKWRPTLFLVFGLVLALLISGSYRLESAADSTADPSVRLQRLQLAALIRPLSPRLHAKTARVHLEHGDLTSANREIRRFKSPAGKEALQVQAFAALSENDQAGALRLLSSSKTLGADHLDQRLEAFLALPDITRALQIASDDPFLSSAAKVSATEPSRLIYASEVMASHQLLAPAHRFAATAAERYPALPAGWHQLAEVELLSNNYPAALSAAERAEKLFPTDPKTHRLKARIYRAMGDTDKAKSAEAKANSLR